VESGLLSKRALARAFSRLHDLPLVDLAATLVGPASWTALERMRRDCSSPPP
jgi:hypothetical protein